MHKNGQVLAMNKESLNELMQQDFHPTVIDSFNNIKVSKITGKFLFAKSRSKTIKKMYLTNITL
jgi:hypothetical protein